MIAGATRGAGGPALGRHLANVGMNEAVIVGDSRGLVSECIEDQVAELTRLGSHARTQAPLYHVHADPPEGRPWDDADRARYWELFEREFGLERQPFASVIHLKGGREHEHRAYLRTRPDGTAIRLDHDFARREKLSRIMEHERGEPFTRGAHNRAVIAALRMERPEVAAAMESAGMHEGPRARATVTPAERLQQDRTGISKKQVAASVAQAWAASDSGPAFVAALAEQGLRLAQGDKCAVVVDGTGNTHSLQRMLAMDARATSINAPRAAETTARLDGMELPSVSETRQAIAAPALPLPPENGPPSPNAPTPPGGGQAAPGSMDAPGIHVVTPAAVNHGGNAPVPAAVHTVPGAMLEDAGPGPGEPPRPGAHPDEIARYTNALHAHAERKHKAMQAFMRVAAAASEASHQAATVGGGHRGTTQQLTTHDWQQWWPAAVSTAIAAGYTAEEARYAVRASGLDTRDSSITAHVHIPQRRAEGTTVQDAVKARDILLEAKGANVSSSQAVTLLQQMMEPGPMENNVTGGGEGTADGHCGPTDCAGGLLGQDRVQAYRAARGLDMLNLSSLRDRLDPARMAVREAERISMDIPGHRVTASGHAGTACWEAERQDRIELALRRVMDRVHAGDRITLTAIRQHGFHEVLRQEGLHVLMDRKRLSVQGRMPRLPSMVQELPTTDRAGFPRRRPPRTHETWRIRSASVPCAHPTASALGPLRLGHSRCTDAP